MPDPTATQCCRSCGAPLSHVFVDLGQQPVSNAMRRPEEARTAEPFYALRTYVCDACKLVQIDDVQPAEQHFHGAYTYFSSYSKSWLEHARRYADMMIARFGLDQASRVVEVASNDGYLLQYFKARGIPVQGIDPAANCAEVAMRERGVPTLVRFFGAATAHEVAADGLADVIAGNNVLAHVPDINDFAEGLKILLKETGRHHARVSPSPEPHRELLLRHHLPRALFLPVAAHRRAALCAPRAISVRSRGARDTRREPAHLCQP